MYRYIQTFWKQHKFMHTCRLMVYLAEHYVRSHGRALISNSQNIYNIHSLLYVYAYIKTTSTGSTPWTLNFAYAVHISPLTTSCLSDQSLISAEVSSTIGKRH